MATDIAKIGFSVETSQLEKGVATLNTFKNTAKSANSTAQSIGTAMNSSSKVFAAAVSAMSKSIASLVSVTKGATVEQIAAANEASDFADRVYRAAKAQDTLTSSVQRASKALKNYSIFMKAASNESVMSRINRLTGVTGLSGLSAEESAGIMRQGMNKKEWLAAVGESVSSRGLTEAQQLSRFNTSNIAAQFQDIAVTAAMGMNPMTIALQQGSQLVGVLNLMEKPLSGIVTAFKSLFNTTSLVTIGLTGLVAAGVQMVDWTGVAQSGLNGLASAMDFIADNSTVVASALMVLATGFTAVGAAMVVLKWSSITAGLKSFGETLGIVGLYVKDFIAKLGKLAISILTNPFVLIPVIVIGAIEAFALFKDSVKSALIDTVDWAGEKINKLIGFFVGLKDVVLNSIALIKKGISEGVDVAKGEASKLMSEAMDKKYIGDETIEKIKNGVVEAVDVAAGAVEKVNTVIADTAKSLGDTVKSVANTGSNKLKEWSDALTKTDEKTKKLKESWEKLQNQVNQDIAGLRLDRNLIGMDTYSTEYEKTKLNLTNQATNEGIPLTPEKITYIKEAADETARLKAENEKLNDVFNTSKSITNSFFQDMRTGLRDGASAWESFGNAVTNVLDRILSKMMDIGVDYLFQSIGTVGTSGGSEKFSWGNVASSIGSWFSGSPAPVAAANGGVFSNGVYSSPTLFKFAKGGKFGVMGEAGPEAVMPLRRGRDGSLGVQADGLGGNDVVVNVYNNSNAQASVNQRQTSQGTEIDVMIDQLVAEKMGQPGTSSNNALTAFNNRRLIAR